MFNPVSGAKRAQAALHKLLALQTICRPLPHLAAAAATPCPLAHRNEQVVRHPVRFVGFASHGGASSYLSTSALTPCASSCHLTVLDDAIDDACSIPTHAVDHPRGHGVQEMQPDEVEPGCWRDDTTVVHGLVMLVEYGQVDP